MERLLPIDLERLTLRRALRGYERASVDQWLANASAEIETLLHERDEAREANARLQSELATHRAQESTLKDALLLATKAADETRALAHREADQIIAGAEARIARMHEQAEGLRLETVKAAAGLRALADATTRTLEAAPLSVVEGRAAPE